MGDRSRSGGADPARWADRERGPDAARGGRPLNGARRRTEGHRAGGPDPAGRADRDPLPPLHRPTSFVVVISVRSALAPLLVACLASACATARPVPVEPGPGEGPVILLEPHWDQVCRDDRAPLVFRRPAEVTDDPTLTRAATALLPDPVTGEPHPHVDVAVNYGRSGEIRTVHLSGHNVDPGVAEAVVARITPAIRTQGPLFQPVFLRVRVTREPAPVLRILPGLDCLPHISHEEDEPPRFLEGARVGGRFGGAASDSWVTVQLHLSRTGEMERFEVLRGEPALLPRVRRAMAESIVDPALINGEPKRGSLILLFGFPD
jgi:hypothetical protein